MQSSHLPPHVLRGLQLKQLGRFADAATAFKDTQWPFALKGSNVEITGSGGTYQFKTVSKDFAVVLSNMPCPAAAKTYAA